jgi:hypothetical protein
MASTYQSIVDLARTPLNDDDKVRYTDATLLLYANHGILQILKRRPDLFVGQFGSLPAGDATLDDTFSLPAGYIQTLADYVTARAPNAAQPRGCCRACCICRCTVLAFKNPNKKGRSPFSG